MHIVFAPSLFLISQFCCRGLFRYKKARREPYTPPVGGGRISSSVLCPLGPRSLERPLLKAGGCQPPGAPLCLPPRLDHSVAPPEVRSTPPGRQAMVPCPARLQLFWSFRLPGPFLACRLCFAHLGPFHLYLGRIFSGSIRCPYLLHLEIALLPPWADLVAAYVVLKHVPGRHYHGYLVQCCGSGMFIPDPGSDFLPSRIPDPNCLHPGSRIPDPRQRI
jgi:hypothetical protein